MKPTQKHCRTRQQPPNIMNTKITLAFLLLIFFNSAKATVPNEVAYLNEAAIVAKVESFTTTGFLNCTFECFLDMNYVDLKDKPELYFQVGTEENPIAFKNKALSENYLSTLDIEKVFSNNSYKLKINFGKIKVKDGFVARLVIIENGTTTIIPLEASNYKDDITNMYEIDESLCKAEQFLRKIQFDRLYEVDYFEDVVSLNK